MAERNWNQCFYIPFDGKWREQSDDVRGFAIGVEAGTRYTPHGKHGMHHVRAQFATRGCIEFANFYDAVR